MKRNFLKTLLAGAAATLLVGVAPWVHAQDKGLVAISRAGVQRCPHLFPEAPGRCFVALHRLKIGKVGSGAEGTLRPGHHQQPRLARRNPRNRLAKLRPARRRNCIAGLGPVERQPGGIIVEIEPEHGAGHAARPPFCREKRKRRKKGRERPIRGGPGPN